VIAAGTLGNVAGSYVAWAVGRYAGQATLRRWGRYIWQRIADDFHGPTYVIAGIIGVAALICVVLFLRRRRREQGAPSATETEPAAPVHTSPIRRDR
jgi:membrane-associated phospholipid phosphatase